MKFKLHLFLIGVQVVWASCLAQSPVLWGLTYSGGANNKGTLFSFSVPDTNIFVHHNFGTAPDGRNPEGSMIRASNGLFYGTVTNALSGGGAGVLFSYDLTTGVYTILHTFGMLNPEGRLPYGRLLEANNGLLYGTTLWGGTYGKGTIFSYNIVTGIYTELYSFGNTQTGDATYPNGSLLQATNGLLYGLTRGDGLNDLGAMYSYDINTNTYNKLLVFNNFSSFHPFDGLIEATDGLLYGLTRDNFSSSGSKGKMFSYNISTNQLTNIHDFGNSFGNPLERDGDIPTGSLIQANDGLLYGLASVGGDNYNFQPGDPSGVLFRYDKSMPAAQRYQILYHFGADSDAAMPWGTLLQASDGALYCLTSKGGTLNQGTIFKYDINAEKGTVLYNLLFSSGNFPRGNLIEDNRVAATAVNLLQADAANISVYPNPTSGFIQVTVPEGISNYLVQVRNVVGGLVYCGLSNTTNITIDISSQPNGLYFVSVLADNRPVQVKRLIINR